MGRDTPSGSMFLANGSLDIKWSPGPSKDYFADVQRAFKEISEAMGGRRKYLAMQLFKRAVTVHPLGGCPMGSSKKDGVVDNRGQVFDYPGLYIADGSTMPGPIGPNPSLTIAAFADRVAEGVCE
jgi:cholesterol oxidase